MPYELLTSAKAGGVREINDLLRVCEPYVRSIANQFIRNANIPEMDSDDISQIVLFQIARDLADCRADDLCGLFGWVATVTRNNVYKEIDRARTRCRDKWIEAKRMGWETNNHIAVATEPIDVMISAEAIGEAMQLAGTIGENTLEVVELTAFGYDAEEISEKVGISVLGVYAVLKRFRKAAREKSFA